MPISLQNAFLVASFIVAVLVFIEAAMIRANAGKLPQHTPFMLVSLVTSVWSLVSLAAIFFITLEPLPQAVAAIYPLYALLSLVYSARLMKDEDVPDDPFDIVIPAKHLSFNQSFALVFAPLCALALAQALGWVSLPALAF